MTAAIDMLSAATLQVVARFHSQGITMNLETLKGPYGETPLHIAAASVRDGEPQERLQRMTEALQRFVRMGIAIDAQDEEGETPLHWAAFAGRQAAAMFLIRAGASPLVRNFDGETALDIAQLHPAEFFNESITMNVEGKGQQVKKKKLAQGATEEEATIAATEASSQREETLRPHCIEYTNLEETLKFWHAAWDPSNRGKVLSGPNLRPPSAKL